MTRSSNYSRDEDAMKRRKDAGVYIKRLREEAQLTQFELSQKLGYKLYTFISQIESGTRTVPSEHMIDWAKALKVDPKSFARTLLRHYDPALLKALFHGEPAQQRGND
jgi:transcriptional regulator with XRE-family HTH domain